MVEDITTDEEEEKVFFPKVDRGRFYSILLIFGLILTIYITIMTNTIWISFFVIIPFLSLSKSEKPSQAKVDFKQLVFNGFSKLVNISLFIILIGIFIYLFIEIGLIFTVILIFISFALYNFISATINRKKFTKNNKLKSEVI